MFLLFFCVIVLGLVFCFGILVVFFPIGNFISMKCKVNKTDLFGSFL